MGKLLVIAALVAASCVRSEVVPCGGSLLCPAGTVCADVTNPQLPDPLEHLCVPPEDVVACRGLEQFTDCTRNSGDPGRCYDGVCLIGGCGNHRVDPEEACDDGNSSVGDGCSVGCASNEQCGNGFVDPVRLVAVPGAEPIPAVNEVCDDGNLVGHDGCDSQCGLESIQWHRLDIGRPPARDNAALAFDSARGRFVLFGGRALGGQGLSDTWESAGGAWMRVTQINAPPAREAHAMVYDAARRRVVLFGGNGALADTWEWDGVSWTLRSPPTSPPGRSKHAMAYDAGRRRVVMFGGKLDEAQDGLDDHWEWDGATWTEIVTTPRPEGRRDHAMAYDPKRGVIVLTGGLDAITSVSTTWELSGSTWTQMPGTLTSQRFAMAYDPISERMIAHGGATAPQSSTTSTYANGQWTSLGATAPGPRVGSRMASDATGRRLWLFGGFVPGSLGPHPDDTWSWNGTSWSEVASVVPTKLAYRASAYDPIRGELVAYGGRDVAGLPHDETSVFSGTEWKLTTGPSARAGAAMAYDAVGRRMLMMGGGTTVFLGDMHAWDGAGWSPLVVTPRPSPRALHAMASDPIRKRIVLFGGTNQMGSNDETWEWDGAAWTQLTPIVRPSARTGHALTYDPTLARVVLVGGLGTGGQLDDTWAWDGVTWSPIIATNRPIARDGHGAAWDAVRGTLTVFGGATTTNASFDDTIELVDSTWRTLGTQQRPDPRTGSVFTTAADGAAGLMMTAGSSAAPRISGSFMFRAAAFSDELWRLRHDGANPYEVCTGTYDNDGDGLSGCADHDCDSLCARCGDGECTALENCRNCPGDCACLPTCGDFFCDPGETAAGCPGDC